MKTLFYEITSKHNPNNLILDQLWQELHSNYTHKKRHYHAIAHIENMLRLANENKELIPDWETFVLAIFYHDAIYNVLKSDNEEQSALLAEKRLKQINYPIEHIEDCKKMILATKQHLESTDFATNLLLDIDLSILETDWEVYLNYTQQIRKEYSIYPDLLYKPGRKKVLEKFLERDFIFRTAGFRANFEEKARFNLRQEILLY
jgi:predicted metal-dependent HD superfamily phosphohydrolase